MYKEIDLKQFGLGLYSGRAFKVIRTMFLTEKATLFYTPWKDTGAYYEDDINHPLFKLYVNDYMYRCHDGYTNSGGNTLLGLIIHEIDEIARNTETSEISMQINTNQRGGGWNHNAYNSKKYGEDFCMNYKLHLAKSVEKFRELLMQMNAAKGLTESDAFFMRLPIRNNFHVMRQFFFDENRYWWHNCYTKNDRSMDEHVEQAGTFSLDVQIYLNELNFLYSFFKGESREKLIGLYGEDFTNEMIGVPFNPFANIAFREKYKANYEKMIAVFSQLFPRDELPKNRDQKKVNKLFSDTVREYEEGLFKLNA